MKPPLDARPRAFFPLPYGASWLLALGLFAVSWYAAIYRYSEIMYPAVFAVCTLLGAIWLRPSRVYLGQQIVAGWGAWTLACWEPAWRIWHQPVHLNLIVLATAIVALRWRELSPGQWCGALGGVVISVMIVNFASVHPQYLGTALLAQVGVLCLVIGGFFLPDEKPVEGRSDTAAQTRSTGKQS